MRSVPQSRAPRLAALALAALGVGLLPTVSRQPLLIYNASASAPLGFYRLVPGAPPERGDLVLAHLPQSAARLAAERRYLPSSVPAVKHVAALAGDSVCENSGIVSINDHVVARALSVDRRERTLPTWQGCRSLVSGEAFLLMPDAPASFDSRYFGPIPTTSIIGRLVPLWTW